MVLASGYTLRRATYNDLPFLGNVEMSAGQAFASCPGLEAIADSTTIELSRLENMLTADLLWAVTVDCTICGFLGAGKVAGYLHLEEVSVHQEHQGKGIGRMLIEEVIEESRKRKLVGVTLTTYRDVPFNGPLYSKFGFVEVHAETLGPRFVTVMKEEADILPAPQRRCCMVRRI